MDLAEDVELRVFGEEVSCRSSQAVCLRRWSALRAVLRDEIITLVLGRPAERSEVGQMLLMIPSQTPRCCCCCAYV